MNKLLLLAACILTLSGCITSKSYVDPSFAKATYNDVKPVTQKYDSNIIVEFQRNGEAFTAANNEVRGHVERTLRATGVINPTTEGSNISIKVIVNNIADIGSAAAKGFGTGLTFGAAGSLVTDYYEATVVYTDADNNTVSKSYKHALHTTVGNHDAPFENVMPTTPAAAFGTVVEQVLLNFITDMQKSGKLTLVEVKSEVHS